jgi:hypothetical protein
MGWVTVWVRLHCEQTMVGAKSVFVKGCASLVKMLHWVPQLQVVPQITVSYMFQTPIQVSTKIAKSGEQVLLHTTPRLLLVI